MKDYKNKLRIRVSTLKGELQPPDDTPGHETPLDKEIIKCAGQCLRGQQLITYFYAYRCVSSWQEIQDLFKERHNKTLNIETVQRYAREAADRIAAQIAKR